MNNTTGGYQPHTNHGPRVRTDVVDMYVFRQATRADERGRAGGGGGAEDWYPEAGAPPTRPRIMFLQLLRASEPLGRTWQPVMGHVEAGETACACGARELREELGLDPSDPVVLGAWALEQVHPFYIAAIDCIVMSPRFALEVDQGFVPRLNHEHSAHRWVHEDDVASSFLWPGQRSACREILSVIVPPASITREQLRVRL